MLRKIKDKTKAFQVRKKIRNRFKLKLRNNGKLRLSVFMSNCHIYAQVIDDNNGVTVASASTLDKELKTSLTKTSNKAAASVIGQKVAERLIQKGHQEVVLDRGDAIYHGKLKSLADAARESGLKF